jgi:hypothetical protein
MFTVVFLVIDSWVQQFFSSSFQIGTFDWQLLQQEQKTFMIVGLIVVTLTVVIYTIVTFKLGG